tara:strand:+ start:304 stop:468 length:165 start_codon:yes stop_codon:yes gene_type:complete
MQKLLKNIILQLFTFIVVIFKSIGFIIAGIVVFPYMWIKSNKKLKNEDKNKIPK